MASQLIRPWSRDFCPARHIAATVSNKTKHIPNMKKITLLILLFFATFQLLTAQNSKLHVSRQGGEKSFFPFGKTTYSYYHFKPNSELGDTLICSGSGYEACKIDKNIIKQNHDKAESYKIFNKTIKATEKHIKKYKQPSGELTLKIKNKKVIVNFYNANKEGEADLDIQII